MTPARRTAGTAARAARRRSWTWGSYEYLNTNGILGAPEPPAAGSPAPEPSGTAYIAFTYDALGRRIERTVDSGGASVEVTRYYYDGQNVLVETDADEAPRRSFVHGSQYIDERVLMRLPTGQEYYYLPRELYSVAALTDETGEIVEAATYDTYGKVAVYDGSAQAVEQSPVGNPYYFTGRRLDLLPTASSPEPVTKQVYHYRARAYDPGNGRFLQRDSVGYTGVMGLYSYVFERPAVWSDPLGLSPTPIGAMWPPPAPDLPPLEPPDLPPLEPPDLPPLEPGADCTADGLPLPSVPPTEKCGPWEPASRPWVKEDGEPMVSTETRIVLPTTGIFEGIAELAGALGLDKVTTYNTPISAFHSKWGWVYADLACECRWKSKQRCKRKCCVPKDDYGYEFEDVPEKKVAQVPLEATYGWTSPTGYGGYVCMCPEPQPKDACGCLN